MTQTSRIADDSCLVNQTVPATGTHSSPEQPEKSHNPDPDHGFLPVQAAGGDEAAAELSQLVEPETTFPEGGLQAWLVVLGSFCAQISVYGLINSAAVFESYFSTHQLAEYDSSAIGWIFSLYLFIVFFVGVLVGPVFDRRGPRLLVAVGSVLVVLSQMLLGFCEEYYQILLTYSVLGGLGGALINVPAYGCIAHHFRARRGLATGVAATSGSVGGVAFPLLLQALLPKLGFAWSTRIVGFMLLGLAVPANLLLRGRLPRSTRAASVMPDWSVFRDLRFSLCCAGTFFMEYGIFIPLTFIVTYAAEHGRHDATDAYTLLALLNAGSFLGRLLPGLLADRAGRFNVIVLTNALCVVTVLTLWLPTAALPANSGSGAALLTAFAVLFGFASGSNLGLYPVCIGQLCDSRDYGRFYSTALMTASFGTLTSVPIGGALLGLAGAGREQAWTALILFSALSYVIAMSCFAAARVLAVSWRVKEVF